MVFFRNLAKGEIIDLIERRDGQNVFLYIHDYIFPPSSFTKRT